MGEVLDFPGGVVLQEDDKYRVLHNATKEWRKKNPKHVKVFQRDVFEMVTKTDDYIGTCVIGLTADGRTEFTTDLPREYCGKILLAAAAAIDAEPDTSS